MAFSNISLASRGAATVTGTSGSDLARAATTSLLGLLQAQTLQQGGNSNLHVFYPHIQHPFPPVSGARSSSYGLFYSNSTPKAFRTANTTERAQEEEARGVSGSCLDWQEAQHSLFQLANLVMAVSFLTPPSFRFHLLFLRCLLLLAFLLFVLWAGLFICMPDVLGWNLVFSVINGAHIAWLFYTHLPTRLPATHSGLFAKVFRPLRVTQNDFLELTDLATLSELHKCGLYALEGITCCGHKVSILLKGRLKVTHQRLFLHHVEVNQFADAAEYDLAKEQSASREKYQVSIAATEDSLLLTWDVPTLQVFLSTRPFMKTIVHYLTGKDVCSHLYDIQEHLLQAPDYMSTLASRHSSMVNVRSCLAANDSSSSLQHMSDFGGYRPLSQSEPSSSTSPNTGETRV